MQQTHLPIYLEDLKPCERAGASHTGYNHNVPPSRKTDYLGAWWGKSEAVSSAGTWEIMKPTNLSIIDSYFNCTSRPEKWELFITELSTNCMALTSDSCSPGGFSPAAQEPGKTPKLPSVCLSVKAHICLKYVANTTLLSHEFWPLSFMYWLWFFFLGDHWMLVRETAEWLCFLSLSN